MDLQSRLLYEGQHPSSLLIPLDRIATRDFAEAFEVEIPGQSGHDSHVPVVDGYDGDIESLPPRRPRNWSTDLMR